MSISDIKIISRYTPPPDPVVELARPTAPLLRHLKCMRGGIRSASLRVSGELSVGSSGKVENLPEAEEILKITNPFDDYQDEPTVLDPADCAKLLFTRCYQHILDNDLERVQFRIYVTGSKDEGGSLENSQGSFLVKREHAVAFRERRLELDHPEDVHGEPADADETVRFSTPQSETQENTAKYMEKIDAFTDSMESVAEGSPEIQTISTRGGDADIDEDTMSGKNIVLSAHELSEFQSRAMKMVQEAYAIPIEQAIGERDRTESLMERIITAQRQEFKIQYSRHAEEATRTNALLLSILDKESKRREQLDKRLDDAMTRLDTNYMNLQNIAQQGWIAFNEGMQMQVSALKEREANISRSYENLAQIGGGSSDSGDGGGAGEVIRELAVPGLLVGAALLKEKNPKAAFMMNSIAKAMATEEEDDEEDEEEDDDAMNGHAAERGEAPSARDGSSPQAGPVVTKVRQVAEMLKESEADIQKAVGPKIWKELHRVLSSTDDESAKRRIARLKRVAKNSPEVMVALLDVVSEDQAEAIGELLEGL